MFKGEKKIVLVGGGGHAKVIIDAIINSKKFIIQGIVDPNLAKGTSVLGFRVIGGDESLPQLFNQGIRNAFISVGSLGDYSLRRILYEKIKNIGFNIPFIIHPQAVVAQDVSVGEGTFIAAGVVINPGTKIGRNAIINTSSSIDHDCQIGDFVHIAPGVTLSGAVKIEEGTHIGTGANVVQGLNIGKNCLIKAGELVRRSIPSDYILSGGNCRIKILNEQKSTYNC